MNMPSTSNPVLEPCIDAAVAHYNAADYPAALDIFHHLAERGDPVAPMWIGACHAAGSGVPYSVAEAFAWYLKAAERGNAQAQTNVGAMLIMGNGAEVDVPRGLYWLQRAADAQDCGAQFNFASLYSVGEVVEQDHSRAFEWYLSAAKQGHYPSQARLGYCYQLGQGVNKDLVQAFVWLSLAARHGVGTALIQLEQLMGQMSGDQKQQGAELIDRWNAGSQAAPERWQCVAV
ncbi:MAG TPA: tetratricopeptide repeat protein [Pseudomonas sp.]|uniref:tetratricopeptide repeat protein n=1 Tax=Pseudomonas sp. TaxID=306 RepID=UPI002EDB9C5E